MNYQLTYYNNSILRKKGEPVTEINDEIKTLVDAMITLMNKHNGIGLAAPQANASLRIFIMSVPIEGPDGTWEDGPLYICINPKLSDPASKTSIRDEGCLSIPGINCPVERPIEITLEATDLNGNLFKKRFSGLEARCIMHENDHINGVLMIDRVPKKERKAFEQKLREIKKKPTTPEEVFLNLVKKPYSQKLFLL
ncbi:peptide deformylase [Chlamydiales bacterium]|nr:peptide deformylase [Chlamydiales bacterium]